MQSLRAYRNPRRAISIEALLVWTFRTQRAELEPPLDRGHARPGELTRDDAAALADQTDMARLSRVEWAEFCERLTRGYLEALQRQADAQVPF